MNYVRTNSRDSKESRYRAKVQAFKDMTEYYNDRGKTIIICSVKVLKEFFEEERMNQ